MAWKPPVNYRTSAVVTPTPEAFEIGADGVALLAEAPADPSNVATPMTVTVGGNARTRVTGSPAAGQYRVKTQSVIYADLAAHTEYLPLLEFHSSDAGLSGTCSYYRTGTVVTTEFYQSMIAFLRPLTGYASSATLPAPTTDPTQRGCPGDMAFTTGGQLYYSDGTQWFAVAGGAGAQFSRTKTVDAGAAVKVALTQTVSSDAAVFNSTTKSQDIAAGGVVLAHQVATVSANAEVVYNVQARTQTASADAAVKAARTQTATADAALKFSNTKTASADASVDGGASSSITYVSGGAALSGTISGLPVQAGDIIIVSVNAASAPNGYTRKTGVNYNNGDVSLCWRRATATTGDNIALPGAGAYGIFRGCVASGDPFDVVGTGTGASSYSGAVTAAGVTTTVANAMVVLAAAGQDAGWDDGDGGAGANTCGWASPTGPATTVASKEPTSTTTNGVGAFLAYGEKASAGATGSGTARFYAASPSPYSQGTDTYAIVAALKPA